MTRPKNHRTLAARLLAEVRMKADGDGEALARALGLTVSELDAYRSGETRMPLEQQLGLARFVLGRIPQCARTARRLVSQAHAEAAYLAKETATHMVAPPSQFWR